MMSVQRRRHVPALDGLRAIAVLMVILYHCHVPGMNLGFLGVDVFFVLSGFLITTLLLDEHAALGRIDFPKFMARRFLRLMPAYWLYAGGITLALVLGAWAWYSSEWPPSRFLASIWLYFNNVVPVRGVWEGDTLTNHLWSLCIEEQFYLLWPPLLMLALRTGVARSLMIVLTVGSFLALELLPGRWTTTMLFTRGFSLCAGCLGAIILNAAGSRARASLARKSSEALLAAVCVTAWGICTALDARLKLNASNAVRVAVPMLAPVVVLLCASLWSGSAGAFAACLSWKPLAYIGRISYGVYLYHMLPRYYIFEVLPERWFGLGYYPSLALHVAATIACALVIAIVSYHALERPIQRLSARFRPLATLRSS